MFCPALSFLAYWSAAVTLVAYGSAALDSLGLRVSLPLGYGADRGCLLPKKTFTLMSHTATQSLSWCQSVKKEVWHPVRSVLEVLGHWATEQTAVVSSTSYLEGAYGSSQALTRLPSLFERVLRDFWNRLLRIWTLCVVLSHVVVGFMSVEVCRHPSVASPLRASERN